MGTQTPAFPLDLEQEIFVTTAILYPETMPTLLLVAHRVLVWIEPLLYRTLLFDNNTRLFSAMQTLKLKSPTFRQNVHDIFLWYRSSNWEDEQINMSAFLSICTGVQNLVLRYLPYSMFPILGSLQLRRLALPMFFLPQPSSITDNPDFLRELTHLHVHSAQTPHTWICQLPSLTHLALSDPGRPSVHNFIEASKKLQVVVCIFTQGVPGDLRRNTAWVDDPRVVIMRMSVRAPDYCRDWKSGLAGGRDFWCCAEEFLAKKQSDKSITTQICDL
ncbi:Tyrosinase central domain-containing protein [Mycena venus]|uniref:Tyrosinase central domain-containing protein n=1 Tax=Mycena venus TaxID=2733690 RepID=A0A8H6Z257_9AGAR|nr:Tyrosinase central domain-containing protein [Mycena venus]